VPFLRAPSISTTPQRNRLTGGLEDDSKLL
jgi:hypothetical protein